MHRTPAYDYPEPCACFTEGYARGKDKACFEMADWSPDHHGVGWVASRAAPSARSWSGRWTTWLPVMIRRAGC